VIFLDRLSLLEKPSAFEDFQWSRGAVQPAPELDRLAGEWLQAHIESNHRVTAVVQRIGGEHWLLRSADQEGTDNAGRRLCRLVAGRLVGDLNPTDLVRGLLGAFQNEIPPAGSWQLPLPELADEGLPQRRLQSAVLTLVGTFSPAAVVDEPGLAVRALELLGFDLVEFVALFPCRLPSRLPVQSGIFISEANWLLPLATEGLARGFPDLEVSLAALGELRTSPEKRLKLLRLLLDLPTETAP
jgi:hypothetical protein